MDMYWSDWVIMAVSLLVLFYLYSTWTFDYWKKRGVPFKKPTPLFGNLYKSTIGKQGLPDDFADIYHEFDSKGYPFCGYFAFRTPGLMLLDPDLLKQITVKDFQSFHDNDIDVSIDVDPMFGRNPFCLRGDRWKKVRSQLTPAFTPGKLKPLFPLISEVCKNMKKFLKEDHPDGVEAKELCTKFTTDVVASVIFGIDGNCFADDKAEFRMMGREMMDMDFWRNLEMMCFFVLPSLAKFFKFRMINEKVTNFFRRVVKETTTYREKNDVTRNDFLQLLMQLKAKGSVEDGRQDEKFTDEDVAAQATTFFTDGFETSSGAMSFMLFEIAYNEEVQERLREEVAAVMEARGGLCYEMLAEMPYLDMVLSETIRLHPIIFYLSRQCTQPYTLATPGGGAFKVEVGTSVTLPTMWLHTNPKYFPEPERFLPERFSEENKKSIPTGAYIPFGSGPRACLGQRFAQMQIKAGIAAVVHEFELGVSAKTAVPLEYEQTQTQFLMPVKGGLWLTFKQRIKSSQTE